MSTVTKIIIAALGTFAGLLVGALAVSEIATNYEELLWQESTLTYICTCDEGKAELSIEP